MEPGARIAGRFEIDHLAGAGGMAEVYRAWDRMTGEAVAVKVLHAGGLGDPTRFDLEAQILAELRHPGIVRHIAHGSVGDSAWLAMEWLEGEDLATRLTREGLTVAQSLALARRIADALGVAHARGVVHRDIKPANVFLPGGDLARAKVLDFGIARRHRGTHAATRTGMMLGTPGYMAPEQVRGARDLDARADVFALGCLMYECLTGSPAFPGDDPMAVLAQIVAGPPPAVSALRPDVPASVADLIASLLSYDPALRPADGAAVTAALDALDPVDGARPEPAAPSLTAGERRLRAVVLSGAAHPGTAHPGTVHPGTVHSGTVHPGTVHSGTVHSGTVHTGGATVVLDDDAPALDGLRAVARAYGARLEPLAGGVLASLDGYGAATDLAARAARCALALRTLLGDAPIALAIGRDDATHGAADDAFVRAAALLTSASREAPREAGTGTVTVTATEPGAVLLDEVAAHLLHAGFEVTETAGSYLLLGERDDPSAARTLLGHAVPCVGRDRELAMLEALYAAAAGDGGASVALVTGAPGEGKSRIVREFLRRVGAQGEAPEVWTARADPLGAGSAFGLLGPAVRRAAGAAGCTDPAAARARLGEFVDQRVPTADAQRVADFLAELTGMPCAAESPRLRTARADAQWMTDQLRRAWQDLVAGATGSRPVILVLEDLQWGAAADVAFVDGALRALGEARWMILATARPEVHEVFPDLWSGRGVQEIRLAPLSPRSSERLVRQVLGPAADPAVVGRLVARAGGHPLFLEELLRAVVEGRGDALPASAVAMVQARVEALEAPARRVLRAASVFGAAAWRRGVATLLGGTETAAGEATEWLDELVGREVLERHEPSRLPGEAEYVFRHALLREAAYAMLTVADRTLGHRLAGAWLESAGERDPLVLAEHHARGGARDRAAGWCLVAAEQCLAASDHAGARSLAARGVDLGAAGATLGRLRLVESEALNWQGEVTQGARRAGEAVALLSPGEDRWFRAAAERGAALGRLGDIAVLEAWVRWTRGVTPQPGAEVAAATCWARSVVHLYYNHRTETADDVLAAAEALSSAGAEDRVLEARLAGARAARDSVRGDLGAVLAETLRAAECYTAAGDARNACMQRLTLGMVYVRIGCAARAAPLLREATDTAEAMGLAAIRVVGRVGLVRVALAEGHPAGAVAHARTAVAEAETLEGSRTLPSAQVCLAEALAAAGDPSAALDLARAVADAPETPPATRQRARAVAADLLLVKGDAAGALALARAAREDGASGGSFDDGEVLAGVVQAEALAALGDQALADAVLVSVRDQVLARTGTLRDATLVRCALEGVAEHARVMSLASRWGF